LHWRHVGQMTFANDASCPGLSPVGVVQPLLGCVRRPLSEILFRFGQGSGLKDVAPVKSSTCEIGSSHFKMETEAFGLAGELTL
jgi:hypothetical protein